ncbi:outer membrane lipoprotein chaperone LolA [Undibacterium luofuense]|uniref:outer membrane lipoprotein chaperone LolA n=1 Tax=Undibacterium luofuense TaxID=2828733 RepID=UPI0030EE51A0
MFRVPARIALVVAAAALLLPWRAVGQQSRPAPAALARSLQERYDRIKDFTADFVQTYRGGVLRTQTQERGRVVIKKPSRMHWTYLVPERKEFVSDGVKVYSFIPQDRQVIISSVPADAQATTPALFLAGKGNIVQDFTASYAEGGTPDTVVLKLVPKRGDPEFEYLLVTVDPVSLQMRGLGARDLQGGDSTLSFMNLKENQGISDKVFAFRIPRGVDVVTDGAPN